MAMDPMDREPNVYNRETNVYETGGRGSNTLAYIIGGLVIALGLLAFLFYDGGGNEPSTTGSTATHSQSTTGGGTGAGTAGTGMTGSGAGGAAGGSTSAPATPTSPQQ